MSLLVSSALLPLRNFEDARDDLLDKSTTHVFFTNLPYLVSCHVVQVILGPARRNSTQYLATYFECQEFHRLRTTTFLIMFLQMLSLACKITLSHPDVEELQRLS